MNTKGFTLIEIIITVTITATIFVLISEFLLLAIRTEDYVNEQNQAVIETRTALDVMIRELREAAPADTGAYPIFTASEQELIFFADTDKDDTTERVRYFLDGSELKRGYIEATGNPIEYLEINEEVSILSRYIRNGINPVFSYYNENYPTDTVNNPLTLPADLDAIRMVKIKLETNVDPARVPNTFTLDTFVHLRNLKENF